MSSNIKYISPVIWVIIGLVVLAVFTGGVMLSRFKEHKSLQSTMSEILIELPPPVLESQTSVEEALHRRRSVREYREASLTMHEIAQLLWAAQGITSPEGLRTAPSAGALYPLEIYLLAGNVEGLASGVYHYHPHKHALSRILEGERRAMLSEAALGQESIREAAAVIVIAAVYERTTRKYGERGIQYVHMEVGSAAQNIYLQAESLNLGTVFIGAFYDDEVKRVVGLKEDEQPLCLMPIGRK